MNSPSSTLQQVSKPTPLPVKPEGIPKELKQIHRWVMWRYVKKQKPNATVSWAKVPFQANGDPASTTNPNTWCDYETALEAWRSGDFDGIGIVLGADVQGIDLDDCRDPDTGELNELAKEVLDRVKGYAEVSPSGTGIKLFAKTNLDGSRTKKEMGVELYREGRYFAVTGQVLGPNHTEVSDEVQALDWLIEKVWGESMSGLVMTGDVADLELALYRAPLEDWDEQRVRDEIAPYLDLEMHYEDWIKVGQALYHQFDGSEEGFALWDEIFQDSSKYGGESYGHDRWRSFKTHRSFGRGPVTLASVIKMVQGKRDEAMRVERDKALNDTLATIEATQVARELQDKVAAQVANNGIFSDIDREQIANAIKHRAKVLGLPIRITTIRAWVGDRTGAGDGKIPEWMKDWVYLTSGDKFFNLSNKQEVTVKGFAAIYNREMPINQHGQRDKADVCALEKWGMEVVTNKAYMPGEGQISEMFGLKYANLYRPEAVPPVPESLSSAEMDAIEIVEQHFEIYFPDERERGLVLSFCAYNVQHPGAKIRWAPYIHGVPGDGKTFFGELIAKAMGEQNVGILTGSTLESPFTGWSIGYGVVVIEEMKQHGSNRFVVMNRIKPFITNTSVEVHEKHKASYTALNRTNYIILSNYLDGAPVDASDRRYMFLSSGLTVQEVENRSKEGYFDRLFGAINEHPGAIRKWLLSIQLHPEFDANGRAPDTDIKKIVIEISKSELEAAAEDLIESGALGVCANVISSAHFTRALSLAGKTPVTTQVGGLLTRLGFVFVGRKKWHGENCRLYLRQGVTMSMEEMVQALDATVGRDFLD
ncbi:Primase, C-terminal 2 [Oxalobacteraceae bacterium]